MSETRRDDMENRAPVRTKWATVKYPSSVTIRPSEAAVAESERAYALGAADDERFARAMPMLLDGLDPPPAPLVGMTFDHRFAPLFENWAASCERHGIDRRRSTIVFPTDATALAIARACGFRAYYDQQSEFLSQLGDSSRYGDQQWTKYMLHQNWVIRRLLSTSRDVLFQDADIIWRHDPIADLARSAASGIDIQMMYDGPNPRFQPIYGNSGFMYFRNSPEVREFWEDVYQQHAIVLSCGSQQQPLNVLLAVYVTRGLSVRLLDEARFANGHLYCGKPDRQPPPEPWVVHHSWTADLEGKLRRYQQHGHWYLPSVPVRPRQVQAPGPSVRRRLERYVNKWNSNWVPPAVLRTIRKLIDFR